MQIKLDMEDVTVSLGNKGVTLRIANNDGSHFGDLRIGQATIEWMRGRKRAGNGVKMSVQDLIAAIEANA